MVLLVYQFYADLIYFTGSCLLVTKCHVRNVVIGLRGVSFLSLGMRVLFLQSSVPMGQSEDWCLSVNTCWNGKQKHNLSFLNIKLLQDQNSG